MEKRTMATILSAFGNGKVVSLYDKQPFLNTSYYTDVHSLSWEQFKQDCQNPQCVIIKAPLTLKQIRLLSTKCSEKMSLVFILSDSLLVRMWQKITCKRITKKIFKQLISDEKGYLLPNLDHAHQWVSSNKVISRQYFHRYYQWQYTTSDKALKRIVKHLVFLFNGYALVEKNFIVWITGYAK